MATTGQTGPLKQAVLATKDSPRLSNGNSDSSNRCRKCGIFLSHRVAVSLRHPCAFGRSCPILHRPELKKTFH